VKPIRIIVTGSRTWSDRDVIWASLDHVADAARQVGIPVIVAHGCASGADQLADEWVLARRHAKWPVEAQRFPAEWTRYGRRAGMVRNQEMVKPGADVCLAFILDRSKGATHCADLAEANDIRTQRIERWSDSPPNSPEVG
jgi:hypothetical protein